MSEVVKAAKPGLTGWHVLGMFVAGFGIIIAVNVTLAVNAVRTFPGVETDSVYVTSQQFDRDRAAQDALGWDVVATYGAGVLHLSVEDAEGWVEPELVSAVLGRATTTAQDSTPEFAWDGQALVAPATLAPGNWNLRIALRAADGTPFRRRIPIRVSP